MKAIGYIRVSTEDQVREGISLDHQEDKIRAYASLNDLDLMEILRDEGISGKDLNRKGMARLLEMVEKGKVGNIIVYDLSRLSRSIPDTHYLISLFESKQIAFHDLTMKVDTSTAAGKMFVNMVAVFNEWYRDNISERTRATLTYKKEQGEWMGRIPFGFKVVENHLVEDPEQVKVIQKAKRLRNQGKTMRVIAKTLDLSLGYVHKALNTNLKTLKALYCSGNGI